MVCSCSRSDFHEHNFALISGDRMVVKGSMYVCLMSACMQRGMSRAQDACLRLGVEMRHVG